jgi:hypothetical protein
METEGLLPHTQVPATFPYPEPHRSSQRPYIPLPESYLNIIPHLRFFPSCVPLLVVLSRKLQVGMIMLCATGLII